MLTFRSFHALGICKCCGRPIPSRYTHCTDRKCQKAKANTVRKRLIQKGVLNVARTEA